MDNATADLIVRFLDPGAPPLSEAERAALNDTLRTDPVARDLLADLSLHARTLRESLNPQSNPTVDTPLSAAGAPIYRKGHEPNSAISNFKFSIFNFQFLAIAAALLAACGLAIYFLALNPEPSPPEPAAQPLANLIENASGGTLTTPGGFISEGRDYPRGEYTLDRGSAEFMLTNSVNVKLRGETRMTMRNNMNVALTRGSAEFVVPHDAKGFTVHLPDQYKIIDLGTAFRVDVDERGDAAIHVTEGTVQLARGDEVMHHLSAGRIARIEGGNVDTEWHPTARATAFSDSFDDGPTDHWSDELGGPGDANAVDYTGGVAAFKPSVTDDRYYLRTADAGYHRTDFTVSVVVRPGNWPQGAAWVGMGDGVGDPERFGEPSAASNIFVRINGSGIASTLAIWDGSVEHQVTTAPLRLGADHRVTLRWHVESSTLTITVDIDNDGGEPDFEHTYPVDIEFPNGGRLYVGGQGDASAVAAFDDFAVTLNNETQPPSDVDGTADRPRSENP